MDVKNPEDNKTMKLEVMFVKGEKFEVKMDSETTMLVSFKKEPEKKKNAFLPYPVPIAG